MNIRQRIKNLLPFHVKETLDDSSTVMAQLFDAFIMVMQEQEQKIDNIRMAIKPDCSCNDNKLNIKEIEKIKLEPNEALAVKFSEEIDSESAFECRRQLCHLLGTDKILVFVGDVELSKVDYQSHKKHPIYGD